MRQIPWTRRRDYAPPMEYGDQTGPVPPPTPPPTGLDVEFTVANPWTGKLRVAYGAFSQDFPVTSPGSAGATITTQSIPVGTDVTVSMLTAGGSPLCLDPGQSFTFNDGAFGGGWAFVTSTNCVSGFTYTMTQTLTDDFPPATVSANATS